MPKISESKLLIVATDGFEQSELFEPLEILSGHGAEVKLA
jgi:protease I